MFMRMTAIAGAVAFLLPIVAAPAFAQGEGNNQGAFQGGLYRMEHSGGAGGESSFTLNDLKAPAGTDRGSAQTNVASQQPASRFPGATLHAGNVAR